MYMNGTHQDTHQDTSRYIKIHQDTYRIGNYTKSYRKLHVTPATSADALAAVTLSAAALAVAALAAAVLAAAALAAAALDILISHRPIMYFGRHATLFAFGVRYGADRVSRKSVRLTSLERTVSSFGMGPNCSQHTHGK